MDKLTESVPALNKFKNILEKDLKDDSKPWTKWLTIAEEKSGVNRVYLFVGKNQLYFALQKKKASRIQNLNMSMSAFCDLESSKFKL